MPQHIDPVTELAAMQAMLALTVEHMGCIKAAVAHEARFHREMSTPVLAEMERLAAIATKAVLRHIEAEGNLVGAQLQDAIRVALVADCMRSADARARCRMDGDRRPAGERLGELQQRIAELRDRPVVVERRRRRSLPQPAL
jgi:hypothetical protein